jgi:hypothetical protein
MKNFNLSTTVLAVSLVFSVNAMAENMSRDQYKSQGMNIESEYKSAMAACDSFAGNANDICVAEAKGKKNVSKAELKNNFKPSNKSRYGLRIAKADAEYSVAAEKCDDKAGNVKDVCLKEARTVQIHQITDAKVKAKTMKAKADANEDANTEKNDADYAVAKDKCDALAGSTKSTCNDDAKARFGK